MEEKKGARKRLPSCLCSLFLFPFTAFLVVLVNPALPICAERGAATDGGNCLTQHLIVELRPGAVRGVIDGSVSSDPKVPCRFHCVDVCAEEQELNYEVLSEAISAVRSSAPLGADWKSRIDEDYEKRRKGEKK